MNGILGKKIGMTSVFDEDGQQIAVTVVETTGNIVVDKRTDERDGYSALVLGFGEKRAKISSKPVLGQFEKNNLVETKNGREVIKRHVREFRVENEELDAVSIGDEVAAAELFDAGELVDVVGTSKGRGFTGVMKRYNFRGGKATHGVHEYYRHGGSIGMCAWPARVFKNKKMPGQHGNKRTTVQKLTVVGIRPEDGVVLIRGGIPGPKGGLVMIKKAIKRSPDMR
ncbi:MAG: 50S ribosomal protein L3 [Myxococcota bacterium]|nr:50S ribosomal protein L3 [Myxococcota bacterium]